MEHPDRTKTICMPNCTGNDSFVVAIFVSRPFSFSPYPPPPPSYSCRFPLSLCFSLSQAFSKKAVDHVQTHLAKKQVPPSLFQVRNTRSLTPVRVSVQAHAGDANSAAFRGAIFDVSVPKSTRTVWMRSNNKKGSDGRVCFSCGNH